MGAEVCASLCPTATTIVNPASAADCDDSDSLRSPGLNEVCDGSRDEDCDLAVDEGLLVSRYVDQDDDGYGAGGIVDVCPGTPQTSTNALDCNDLNDEVHPNQTGLFYQPACPMGETVCTDSGGAFGCRAIDGSTTCRADARYWDYDCDGGIYYGPPALSCTGGVCPGGCTGTGPSYVENYTNCGRDKTNAYCGCASGSCAAYASPGTTRIFCR